MKLGIINSAFAQAGKGTRFGLEAIKDIGFDTVDIFTDPLDIDTYEKHTILETCQELELPIISLCCVALGLIDFNPAVRHFHLKRCRSFLDLASELGCSNLLLVLGEYVWQKEVIPPENQWELGVDAVQELGKYASERGLRIAIELEPFQLSLIRSIDTMLQFLHDVGQPDVVRANCDISHLHLVQTPPSDIQRLKGWIEHVHVSDCDGSVHGDLPPGHGVTPISDYIAAIHGTGYDGVLSVELEYSPEPDRIFEWVVEAYAATASILKKLGYRKEA
ncbi:MAG: sugar phosphate isomerase/epimerase family protein [Pirellulales bacterium]